MSERINTLISNLWSWRASDLFICEGKVPAVRIDGSLRFLEQAVIERAELDAFIATMLTPNQQETWAASEDLDAGLSLPGGRRMRLNLSRQHAGVSVVLRVLPEGELSFAELGLPPEISGLFERTSGLVLVTGLTGAGKSTTLAAMVHHLNRSVSGHIVTLEDPIEFVHQDIRSRVSQREMGNGGLDQGSFANALRQVVRQSPNVIVVGEIRDAETAAIVFQAALTGHLVLATMHTANATQSLQRLVSLFPQNQAHLIAADLASCLNGVVSQRLLPKAEGEGRALAVELMTSSPGVRRLIREQRIDELEDLMRASADPSLSTFTGSLSTLYQAGTITYDIGLANATNPDEFALMAKGMSTGVVAQSGEVEHASTEVDIRAYLAMARRYNASDLHLSVGRAPSLRINGTLRALGTAALTAGDLRLLLYSILTGRQRSIFELEREIDFALSMDDGQRFRVNAYHHQGNMAASLRAIPTRIPEAGELGLPHVLLELAERSQGLLLVVGPTGSGKTTTMACLLDRINRSRPCRIITIEDPIEYVFDSALATIDQREVGEDTASFSAALKYILRQDPDVIMVGEMRDLETISAALTAAETGHFVMATLHTNDAIQTIDRIVDVFPPAAQQQVRAQLSSALIGVVSQRLLPTEDGSGRCGVFEIMVANSAIRTMIRDNKMHQAAAVLETGAADGMIPMDKALAEAVYAGRVSLAEARRHVRNPKMLSI